MAANQNENGFKLRLFSLVLVIFCLLNSGGLSWVFAENGEWKTDLSLQLIGGVGGKTSNDTPLNYANKVMQIPSYQAVLELRPELKSERGMFSLRARPRFIREFSKSRINSNWEPFESLGKFQWSEAYVEASIGPDVLFSYGLQNLQWGQTETLSPSNRIFRDSIQVKDTLYDVRGRHSFKLNYSPSKDWSVIGFAEIAETGEMGSTEFEAEEAFGKKAVLKAEKNFSGGAHTLGFVAGLRERHGGWFGSYGSAEVLDGLTLFGDLGAEVGSANWYPVFDKQTGLTTLSQIYRNSGRVSTSSVLGARYSFTGGTDFRVEWIFQELGYTASQIETIYDAASSRSPIQQAKNIELLPRLIKSGLELPGRQYLMASLRIPDVFEFQKTLVYSRILFSPRDYSATAYLTVEIPVSSYGTSFVELYQSFGENQSELKGFVGSSFLAGYRQYF